MRILLIIPTKNYMKYIEYTLHIIFSLCYYYMLRLLVITTSITRLIILHRHMLLYT